MTIEAFTATLQHAEMIAPEVRHFKFVCSHAFHFIPGQFITIHITVGDKMLRRSYSIANLHQTGNTIEIAAAYVTNGPASEYLFALKPDDCVQMTGPFGRLVLKDDAKKRYILVGTGTGIVPYRAMLPALQRRTAEQDQSFIILQGVQKRHHVLYGDDFLSHCQTKPALTFSTHYSREQATDLAQHENIGYVQHAFEQLALNPVQDIVYLCGNPNMIDQAYEQLKTIGFDAQSVRREKYISK